MSGTTQFPTVAQLQEKRRQLAAQAREAEKKKQERVKRTTSCAYEKMRKKAIEHINERPHDTQWSVLADLNSHRDEGDRDDLDMEMFKSWLKLDLEGTGLVLGLCITAGGYDEGGWYVRANFSIDESTQKGVES
jgi:hypothetical protein